MTHQEKMAEARMRMAQTSIKMDKMQQERMTGIGAYLILGGFGCMVYAFTGSFALALGFCLFIAGAITLDSVAKTQAAEKNKDGV